MEMAELFTFDFGVLISAQFGIGIDKITRVAPQYHIIRIICRNNKFSAD